MLWQGQGGLQQLAREGLLEEEGAEREGNRPPRTVYKITEKGQEELLNLLRHLPAEGQVRDGRPPRS